MQGSEKFMRLALELAREYKGLTSPNPSVGAVIVKQGKVLSTGAHKYAGAAHAEVDAISKLTPRQLKGAQLYVTLEPCSTWGKTPPCTDAIKSSGIKRVIIGMHDPNPVNCKKCAKELSPLGIEVEAEDLGGEVAEFYAPYILNIKEKRPFVTIKAAQTIDGKIALENGASRWITSKESRRFVHEELRYRAGAVLIGMGTAQADNPSLTIRIKKQQLAKRKNPLYRVVLDANLRLNHNSNLAKGVNPFYPLIVIVSEKIDRRKIEGFYRRIEKDFPGKARHIKILPAKQKQGKIALRPALKQLYNKFGINELLVEGGAMVFSSFAKASLMDRAVFCIAPKILGKGISAFRGVSFPLKQRKMSIKQVMVLGGDVILDVYRNYPGSN